MSRYQVIVVHFMLNHLCLLLLGFVTRCFSLSACSHRGKVNLRHPRPRHMERRILEAITQPIYSQQLNDPGKLCAVIEAEKGKSPEKEEALLQVGICIRE